MVIFHSYVTVYQRAHQKMDVSFEKKCLKKNWNKHPCHRGDCRFMNVLSKFYIYIYISIYTYVFVKAYQKHQIKVVNKQKPILWASLEPKIHPSMNLVGSWLV